ncbi:MULTISPECIES: SHOCT domain-containing protein [Prauserella salsuginis group]|uniref:SHOCT domain-containing protein n=1 Tax=Prauserella salsuginis TaxID=387889 RepID=A0ABW6G8J5_9PSEU|nr:MULTISPECIES: SHOCT domain-containing protein [Prauserella salsuginis group]
MVDMMDGMMGMGWWMALWGIVGLAVLVLVVLGAVWLARNLGDGRDRSRVDGAEQEVRQLYAAGQIDRDEYLRRLDDLRNR